MKKIVLEAFVLVLLSTAVVVSFVRPAVAEVTIYIRADGSIEGTDKIVSADNVTYTFTDNIANASIVVERDNITIDGAGNTLQGPNVENIVGVTLFNRNNVTIRNLTIAEYKFCIWLAYSSNITITRSRIIGSYGTYIYNFDGIHLEFSSNNTIENSYFTETYQDAIWINQYSNNNSIIGNNMTQNDSHQMRIAGNYTRVIENTITKNYWESIYVYDTSSHNIFSDNYIASEYGGKGIVLDGSQNNAIFRNNITDNTYGILLLNNASNNDIYNNTIMANTYGVRTYQSNGSRIYHNFFINNTNQVWNEESVNIWDNGYPSGGNYWSDFKIRYPSVNDTSNGPYQNISGSDGIWDAPYIIDGINRDNYPIVPEFPTWTSILLILIVLTVAITVYKRRLLKTPIH